MKSKRLLISGLITVTAFGAGFFGHAALMQLGGHQVNNTADTTSLTSPAEPTDVPSSDPVQAIAAPDPTPSDESATDTTAPSPSPSPQATTPPAFKKKLNDAGQVEFHPSTDIGQ